MHVGRAVYHESVGIIFDNTVEVFLRPFTVDTVRQKLYTQ